VAAHEFDELFGDGQSEAGAGGAADGAGVDLAEGFEQAGEIGGGDADAGVGDGEAQEGVGVVLGFDLDAQPDLAVVGELDGVADEVGEDLAEADGVDFDVPWDGGGDPAEQVEVFGLGALGEEVERGFDELEKVGVGRAEGHLARFDFGEIEDVVDDGQQGVGAGADGFREVALLGGERGAEEELGHADDAVHGGADLVAHGGEKFALGLGGVFGGEFGLLEGTLGVFARGDVFFDGDVVGGPALGVGDGGDAGELPVLFAVLLEVLKLAVPGLAGTDGLPKLFVDFGRGAGGAEDAWIFAEGLLLRVAGDFCEFGVYVLDLAVEVRDDDGGGAELDGAGEFAEALDVAGVLDGDADEAGRRADQVDLVGGGRVARVVEDGEDADDLAVCGEDGLGPGGAQAGAVGGVADALWKRE